MSKIILDLCSGTGAWSEPYKKAGYKVIRLDIKEGKDVRLYKKPYRTAYGVLAAPPCTNLAASGAHTWREKGKSGLLEALSIVDACLRIIMINNPTFWALENPVGRLKDYLGSPKMRFHPYMYGDPYTKLTCLWGDFKKPKQDYVEPTQGSMISQLPEKPGRSTVRSITPAGFAKAFYKANQ